jgi:hypothetical protein
VLEGTLQIHEVDWKGYCKHVENPQQEYWGRDILMEARMQQLLIGLEGRDIEIADTVLDAEDAFDSE